MVFIETLLPFDFRIVNTVHTQAVDGSTMKLGLLFIGLLAIVVAESDLNGPVVAVEEAPAQLIDELQTPLLVDEPENGVRDKRTLLLKKKLLLKKALLLGG